MKQKKKDVLENGHPNADKTANKTGYLTIYLFIFLLSVMVLEAYQYFFHKNETEWLRNLVMTLTGLSTLVFVISKSRIDKEFDYDNEEHPKRFLITYLIGLFFAFICPFLPVTGWPFMAVSLALALFSNWLIGIVASSVLIMIAVFLSGAPASVFILYFMVGTITIVLFHKTNEDFQVGIPITVSLLSLLVVETACTLIFVNENLSLEMFAIPAINLFVSSVLLVILLKYFLVHVVHRFWERMIEMNDQEYTLMVELKENSRDEYYHAIHTAYFCDLLAKRIGVDSRVTKAGGYYHRIFVLKKDLPPRDAMEQIMQEHNFPPTIQKVLLECLDASKGVISKEAAIIYFSDSIISSVMYLTQKNPDKQINYEQLIQTIFSKKESSGILNGCELSLKDYAQMKKTFLEEKLYYDFLH